MRLLKRRGTAFAFLVLSVLVSVFGIGGVKLYAKGGEAREAFFEGQSGFSPYEDLLEAKEYSYNLVRIAEKNLPSSDESLLAVKEDWERLDGAKTPQEYGMANGALCDSLNTLYDGMAKSGSLDEGQKEMAYRQYVDFCGKQSNLQYDSHYREKALGFNKSLSVFPARWIARAVGIKEMPLF